jgi:hypothetical protein
MGTGRLLELIVPGILNLGVGFLVWTEGEIVAPASLQSWPFNLGLLSWGVLTPTLIWLRDRQKTQGKSQSLKRLFFGGVVLGFLLSIIFTFFIPSLAGRLSPAVSAKLNNMELGALIFPLLFFPGFWLCFTMSYLYVFGLRSTPKSLD